MAESPSSPNATTLYNRALNAYNAADFPLAAEHCREALTELTKVSNAVKDSVLFDKIYERMVVAYQRQGKLLDARRVINEWLDTTLREEGRIITYVHLCRVEDFSGNYEQAIRLAETALELAEEDDYLLGQGFAKRVRADIMWKLGQTDNALDWGQEALTLLKQTSDLEQQAGAHVSLSIAYSIKGQFDKAIQQLHFATRIMEQLGQRYELSVSYSNLGENYALLYAMDKALNAHQRALELVGEDNASPDLLRNLGIDLVSVGRTDEGREYLLMALERAQLANDPDHVAQALYSLAMINLEANHLTEAEEYGNELLAIANEHDSVRHQARALMILGEIAYQQGDFITAQAHLHDSSLLAQRSANNQTVWQTHAALHKLMHETMPQMAEIHRRIAAEMMTTILNSIEDDELRAQFREAEPVRSVLDAAAD